MCDPLACLFDQFLKERVYLKAVTPKTRVWYETSWKAFNASQTAVGDGGITKARLQAFVVSLRDRGVRAPVREHVPSGTQRLLPMAA